MNRVVLKCCNMFLVVANLLGSIDVSLISRDKYYQPVVPAVLLDGEYRLKIEKKLV